MSRCEYQFNEHCLHTGRPSLSKIALLPMIGEVEGPGTAVSKAKACTAAGKTEKQQTCDGYSPVQSGVSEEDSV